MYVAPDQILAARRGGKETVLMATGAAARYRPATTCYPFGDGHCTVHQAAKDSLESRKAGI